LEDRVRARTAELESANENYRQAQGKLARQVERLNLVDRITRAIGERQDLGSIYFVVLRSSRSAADGLRLRMAHMSRIKNR